MKITEAFASLGYRLANPPQDWSAENEAGVCITIWKDELSERDWLDTREHCGPLNLWQNKPGNRKRKKHLLRAVNSLYGYVDVIIIFGTPGVKIEYASPHKSYDGNKWKVTYFDIDTGHFRVEKSGLRVVNLAEKLATFDQHWSPRTVALFNGHDVMVVKVEGEFTWHKHDDTDDFFLILTGELDIELRERTVSLKPGEIFIVPKGVEHRPVARKGEVHLMLIEPTGTPNTGDPATAAKRVLA